MEKNNKKSGIPIGAFAVGALAGAIAAVLLTPKSGKKMRADAKDVLMKIKDEVSSRLQQLHEISEETYDQVAKTVVTEYKNRKALTEEQAHDIWESLRDGYQELKAVATKTRESIKDDIDAQPKKTKAK